MSLSKTKNKFYNAKANEYTKSLTKGSLYDKVNNLIGSNLKILDIGSANGLFDNELKKKQNKVFGIEISGVMAEKSKKYLDKVVVGDIEEMSVLPWKKNYFDVILLMDVLEHLFLPELTLRLIKPYLKKSGVIITTLPNVANWEVRKNIVSGKFDYEKSGIMDSGHIRFFTQKTATKMFKDSGYSVLFSDCILKLPSFLSKLDNRFKFLNIQSLCKNKYRNIFAYQFIFLLKRV